MTGLRMIAAKLIPWLITTDIVVVLDVQYAAMDIVNIVTKMVRRNLAVRLNLIPPT